MSDEEKKAIEKIDYIQDFIIENGQYNADVNDMEYFSRILNLIEKQSKEIEELKNTETYKLAIIDKDKYISKDKIKAKIEEAKKNYNDLHTKHLRDCGTAEQRELAKIEVLQSLLEKE